MKIIDEKGRFFGKINLVDLLIVLFLFSVIILGIKFFSIEKKQNSKIENINNTEIGRNNITKTYVLLKLYDNSDFALNQEHIKERRTHDYWHLENIYTSENESRLIIVINTTTDDYGQTIYKNEELKIDDDYYLFTPNIDIKTQIIKFSRKKSEVIPKIEEIKFKLYIKNVPDWEKKYLQSNSEIKKDLNGVTVASVENVSIYKVVNDLGTFYDADVLISMKMFKNNKLLLGQRINVYLDDIILYGVVSEII